MRWIDNLVCVVVQVPRDDVRKMEAEGNVCDVHVAGAVAVGFEQERSSVQLRSGILRGDFGAWPLGCWSLSCFSCLFLSSGFLSVIGLVVQKCLLEVENGCDSIFVVV